MLGSLTLSVESLDGMALAGYTYSWKRATGINSGTGTNTNSVTVVAAGTTSTVSATARSDASVGEYSVVLTDAAGNTCVAYTTISAKPCTEHTAAYGSCKNVTVQNPDATNAIANLAPGDEFYAGDYKVTVTSISGGGPGGWTGEGIVDVTLLKGINLPAQVTFTNAKLNECYELSDGTLVTKYDPSWFLTPEIDQIVDFNNDLSQSIDDFANNYNGSAEDKIKVNGLLKEIDEALSSVQNNTQLPQEIKDQIIAGLVDAQCVLQQIAASLNNTGNARLAVSSCISCLTVTPACLQKLKQAAKDVVSPIWKAVKEAMNALGCYGTYAQQEGLIPKCWWKDATLPNWCENPESECGLFGPIAAGIIDGTWETVKGTANLLEVIACNSVDIGLAVTSDAEYTTKLVQKA